MLLTEWAGRQRVQGWLFENQNKEGISKLRRGALETKSVCPGCWRAHLVTDKAAVEALDSPMGARGVTITALRCSRACESPAWLRPSVPGRGSDTGDTDKTAAVACLSWDAVGGGSWCGAGPVSFGAGRAGPALSITKLSALLRIYRGG